MTDLVIPDDLRKLEHRLRFYTKREIIHELIKRIARAESRQPVSGDVVVERISKLEADRDALKLQAQIWAQEALAQKATVHACYEIVTRKTGEPGDWNGAEPIRSYVIALRAKLTELESARAHWEGRTVSAEARMTAMEQARAKDIGVMPERIASLLDVSEEWVRSRLSSQPEGKP